MENLLKKSEHKRLTTVRDLTSEKRKDKRRSFYWNEIGLAEVISEEKHTTLNSWICPLGHETIY